MKSSLKTAALLAFLLIVIVLPSKAQDQTTINPQAAPGGVITGVVINRSKGGAIPQSLDVMLHIMDQNYAEKGMLHGKSLPDGSYKFDTVPLDTGLVYAVMGIYQGVAYYSNIVPLEGKTPLKIDLPIYENTNDLSQAQVNQMHVLFNFAQDGLEVKEIYILSNLGDRTITGTLKLDENRSATILYPLPAEADYIFFEPNDSERFVKLTGGFADRAPLVPGERSDQLMVNYLLPASEQLSYTFTAPLNIKMINFLLPAAAGVTLNGENLGAPQKTALQDGKEYLIYSLESLASGQTINLTFSGKPNLDVPVKTQATKSNGLYSGLVIGAVSLGFILVVLGIWWWRKSKHDDSSDEEIEPNIGDSDLDQIILKIAQLDEAFESGKINEEDYRRQRQVLSQEAKVLMAG